MVKFTSIALLLMGVSLGSAKLTSDQQEQALNALYDCSEEWKVDTTKLAEWNKAGEHFKDILACVGLKVRILDQDGNIDTNLLKEYLSKLLRADPTSEDVLALVDKCAIKKESAQETAFHFFTCMESIE